MPSKSAQRMVTCGRLLACFWLAFWPSPTFSAEYTSRYDGAFRASVAKWWPDLPMWELWKAQCIAESRLDPNAVSPVGAEGLAQFMEPTWRDAIKALAWPQTASRRDADYAIEGGAWYMHKLRAQWKPRAERTPLESHWLGTASYNRGTGWIVKDQAACGNPLLWADIEPCTAKKTMETVLYVRHIKQYWQQLIR